MIFVYSDTHFDHENVIGYCKRPFDNVDHMNSKIILNWNRRVSEEDHVIFLGDFAFAGLTRIKDIAGFLNGHKTLVRGNHDHSREKMLRAGFNEVYDEIRLTYKGHNFLLSHYPYRPTCFEIIKSFFLKRDLRYLERRPLRNKKNNSWLIHGHVHNSWGQINEKLKMVNVSCDVWGFFPQSLDDIVTKISKC